MEARVRVDKQVPSSVQCDNVPRKNNSTQSGLRGKSQIMMMMPVSYIFVI